MKDELSRDFIDALQRSFRGEIRSDPVSRKLYSTDASIYQIEPLGVAFPLDLADLAAAVQVAWKYEVPVLPRGSGSSLAGQAIGKAFILDCSKHLNHLVEINPQERTATVEPGVILAKLNREASRYGLQFGPDPASADRASIGGSIANNATGAHSIAYGMASDHILAAEIILSDGSRARVESISLDRASQLAQEKSLLGKFYAAALQIRENYAGAIQTHWPNTWRRASGYGLNYLLPWSATEPPMWASSSRGWGSIQTRPAEAPYPPLEAGHINLAQLLAGSEGTLAVLCTTKLRLVPKPKHTILGILNYSSIVEACDEVPHLLDRHPSAVELIPRSLIQLARSVPAYAGLVGFVDSLKIDSEDPAALLVLEFAGDDPAELRAKVRQVRPDIWVAETNEAQKGVWEVRKVGLGILMSRLGDSKPVAFIEDTAVPVEKLGLFVRELDKIFAAHGTSADFYAHASAGCLHVRPILNLKTVTGVENLRSIAEQAVSLTISLEGSVSAEHGDGIARGEWLEKAYGSQIVNAFRLLKSSVDPKGLLNPGKKVDPPKMDNQLRYGPAYQADIWEPVFHYQSLGKDSERSGFLQAIEQCNGAGVCRKMDGVMCPSFQVTQEEMHSTRGRANLLRAMVSGQFSDPLLAQKAIKEALDLCLACKGCKSECPSGVDVAKLKYEFIPYYYNQPGNRRPLRDYLFGYIEFFGKLGHYFAPLVNPILRLKPVSLLAERLMGLDARRPFPALSSRSLQKMAASETIPEDRISDRTVLLLSDTFTEFFQPQAGYATIQVLNAIGDDVLVLPVIGAGRTLISKGFLEPARKHAQGLVEAIQRIDPEGTHPIVGVEPSEILTLRDEYLDFFPEDPYVRAISQRAFMIDEYLLRPGADGEMRFDRLLRQSKPPYEPGMKVLLHGHCYQKAQPLAEDGYPAGVSASKLLLSKAGYAVSVVDDGCCGMAGAFGYEAEHYDISIKVGELSLFPAIRQALVESGEQIRVAAAGVSCQAQIRDGTQVNPYHPIELVAEMFLPKNDNRSAN